MIKPFFLFLFPIYILAAPKVELGIDRLFNENYDAALKGKRVGLVTNQTGVDSNLKSTIEVFLDHSDSCNLVALFGPEHGLDGKGYAFEKIKDSKHKSKIPVYSLHGETRRPTKEMLKNIDVLVYDIQDIGVRAYTYITTMFYCMEAASKEGIEMIILDRPNPLTGLFFDGPMMEKGYRSYIGYINVPYCHGMTVGELALFFNQEYKVKCKLSVVPMKGWKREMTYLDTGLHWVPTSPHIPEPTTPFYTATTGIIGELSLVNIGIGYTLPFKVVGATWIDADHFAAVLNQQNIPGAHFQPIHYKPFYGSMKGLELHGVQIHITNYAQYRPQTTQCHIIGILKTLYPQKVTGKLATASKTQVSLFNKANGNDVTFKHLQSEKYVTWKLINYHKNSHSTFAEKRKQHLLY